MRAASGNTTPFALWVIDSQNVFTAVGVLVVELACLRETCAEHNVEIFETFMGLSGLVNVGKGAVVVAFASEAHKFE